MSQVRDRSLAPSGRRKIDWVSRHMPVLSGLRDELSATRPLAGVPVAVCCHLEAKTAFLAEALAAAGAEVAVAGSNPLSTQDDVAAALAEAGIAVYAWRGATSEEYVAFLHRVLDHRPALIMDDGGDLIALAHTDRRDVLPAVRGGSEETTTGIQRLLAMERQGVLAFPVMATNNARMKHLFDNRYGTGQSVWDGIMRTTNLLVAGKTVVVAGYGWCGKGVARRAAGLGAQVIVTEVDPVLASEALMDGFRVMRMQEAAPLGDIFVTVTGTRDVIGRDHLAQMKDGAILANAGHFDVEISKPDLRSLSRASQAVRPNVEAFELEDGRRLYLMAEGRLVNLAAGDGHPAEIMDLSFAVQMLALLHVQRAAPSLGRRVVPIGPEIDQEVARRHLAALGVRIDELTPEQAAYRASWLVE